MFRSFSYIIFSIILILNIAGCNKFIIKKKEELVTSVKIEEQTKSWEQSPLFEYDIYTMIGEEGRIGFIYDDDEVSKFYPDKTQKYMWHIWDEDEKLEGEVEIYATHEDEEESIYMLSSTLTSYKYRVDKPDTIIHKIPSGMSLPKSGMWRFDVFIGQDKSQPYASIYVKVHEMT
ncbi:hypothetical protein [Chengkuizengella axinellae]|uniref:DUF4871 domain-containing protein n=1 Tax=Chengkuizengella axinellae TaxID=3064388 RepID=A0ABT9J0S6_9BACL|nr:hypothetical protein [Chengkuizengella sp. 2205SS18-9]MDP5275224.1 hypothetical protein [Chengkuizengella sp. 2205SS18-9]